MERRELLKMIALFTGSVLIGGDILASNYKDLLADIFFSDSDIMFLDEVADTILPPTKSPGAKAAKVGKFMTVMVNDTYNEKDRKVFYSGIALLNNASKKMNSADFMNASPEQKTALLVALDKESKEYQKTKKNEEPTHYFIMMKQLTIFGYFTSEEGATQALRYVAVPGKYDGNVDYKKGDKAWAT
jgi:hypothetical protein